MLKFLSLGAGLSILLILAGCATQAHAFAVSQPADSKLAAMGPTSIAFDSSGNLWAGTTAGQVLRFSPPLSSTSTPSLLLYGSSSQGSSFSTSGAALDPSGNLWVATGGQGRILEFRPPFSSTMEASLVIGQPDFQTVYSGPPPPPSDKTLDPVAIAFDSAGDLWAVDGGGGVGNRILEFVPPFSNGMSASLVIGQPTFNSNGATLSQNSVGCSPLCVLSFDHEGDLWVVSQAQNRVLEFRPPFSNGMDASLVIGQATFQSGSASGNLNGLSQPFGETFDSVGDLWVGDVENNHRVLEFKPPFANGMDASLALGQPTLGSPRAGVDPSAGAVAFDQQGNLWVSDPTHGAIAEFLSSVTTVSTTASSTSSSEATELTSPTTRLQIVATSVSSSSTAPVLTTSYSQSVSTSTEGAAAGPDSGGLSGLTVALVVGVGAAVVFGILMLKRRKSSVMNRSNQARSVTMGGDLRI